MYATVPDINLTMAASDTYEALLKKIRTSNLNFRIEQSPFSAIISLKKSLVKDKTGQMLKPPLPDSALLQKVQSDNQNLSKKIDHLENIVKSINSDLENSVQDCESAYKTISKLQYELNTARLPEENIKKEEIDEIDEIEEIKVTNATLAEVNASLQKEISHLKVDLEQSNIEKSIHEDRKKEFEHQIENLKYKHQLLELNFIVFY